MRLAERERGENRFVQSGVQTIFGIKSLHDPASDFSGCFLKSLVDGSRKRTIGPMPGTGRSCGFKKRMVVVRLVRTGVPGSRG